MFKIIDLEKGYVSCIQYGMIFEYGSKLLLVREYGLWAELIQPPRAGQPIRAVGPNDAQPRLYKPGAVLTVHILAAATGEGRTSELYEALRSRGLDVRLLWYEYFIHLKCKCMREEIGIKSIVTSCLFLQR